VDILFAAAQPGQDGGGFLAFLPFILIMAILYFFMIRPQTKKQKEKEKMLSELKKGDKVISSGGIFGTVSGFKNSGRSIILKVDKNTNLTLNKTAIAGLAGKVSDTDFEGKS
tara:strand:+ start:1652 stop:1987 length:336 start_codon:yes stop_codon:yes gene_type:complete